MLDLSWDTDFCTQTGIDPIGCLDSETFGLGLGLFRWLSWTFILQMTDHGTSQAPYSCESITHRKPHSTYLYKIKQALFLWKIWLIQCPTKRTWPNKPWCNPVDFREPQEDLGQGSSTVFEWREEEVLQHFKAENWFPIPNYFSPSEVSSTS